jgi:hypothetical protein
MTSRTRYRAANTALRTDCGHRHLSQEAAERCLSPTLNTVIVTPGVCRECGGSRYFDGKQKAGCDRCIDVAAILNQVTGK